MNGTPEQSSKQSDTLLWLGGALVVGMGATWLVLAKPWSDGAAPPIDAFDAPSVAERSAPPPSPRSGTVDPATDAQGQMGSSLEDNPLRMARLAHEAGMLVEPEDYSAWALYRRALQADPDNPEALKGLETIATELVRRAQTALEQGRFDDVRATVERIRSAIPVHPGANELEIRLNELTPRPTEPRVADTQPEEAPEPPPAEEPQTVAETAPAPAEEPAPQTDPITETHEAFTAALSGNRLLTPVDQSARHYVGVLTSIAPDHELTRQARQALFEVFLGRAESALGTRDTDAAETWIAEAERLNVDGGAIAGVRAMLHDQLIEIESARRLPASELTIVNYAAPAYPTRALERQLDGWVDLEFTVDRQGTTRDIVVTDASHNSYFRDEAAAAVAQWRFEPHIFLEQPIEQRAYTRIRFQFE